MHEFSFDFDNPKGPKHTKKKCQKSHIKQPLRIQSMELKGHHGLVD